MKNQTIVAAAFVSQLPGMIALLIVWVIMATAVLYADAESDRVKSTTPKQEIRQDLGSMLGEFRFGRR